MHRIRPASISIAAGAEHDAEPLVAEPAQRPQDHHLYPIGDLEKCCDQQELCCNGEDLHIVGLVDKVLGIQINGRKQVPPQHEKRGKDHLQQQGHQENGGGHPPDHV